MTRTNIDIDDVLIAEAMRRFGCPTKREAVDFALRRMIGGRMTHLDAVRMEGSGWHGDLAASRIDRTFDADGADE